MEKTIAFTPRTAASALAEHLAAARAEIARLQANLDKYEADFAASDQRNWGYAGSASHCVGLIKEAAASVATR